MGRNGQLHVPQQWTVKRFCVYANWCNGAVTKSNQIGHEMITNTDRTVTNTLHKVTLTNS